MPPKKIPQDPKVAVAYLRVSTDTQKLGPGAQRAAIEAWAESHDVRVVSWHFDEGVSGSAPPEKRPALMAAIGALKTHRAGVFMVAKRDRLARDTYYAGAIYRLVELAGSHVISADGTANGATPEDQLMRVIFGGTAAYERELIRVRVKAVLAVKKKEGKLAGNCPWGHSVGPDGVLLVPNDREIEITRKIMVMRADGLSYAKIAEKLSNESVAGRTGKPLAITQIANIVTLHSRSSGFSKPPKRLSKEASITEAADQQHDDRSDDDDD